MNESGRFEEGTMAARVVERAAACSIALSEDAARVIARHMRCVLEAEPSLHLTAIRDVSEFLERHVGESLEGAAMLDATMRGALLDLGSGNGYPGLPIAACRDGLRPVLVEATRRKAAFLRSLTEREFPGGVVIERQVQRAADLAEVGEVAVVSCRGMGNWERVLPRIAPCMSAESRMLVWAGEQMETVARRTAWRRLRRVERRALPGRERSWVWCFSLTI